MRTRCIFLIIAMHFAFAGLTQYEGNALNFNATNGYCSANLPSVFDNISTNDFTIECWIKHTSSSTSKRVMFAQKDDNNFCSILVNGLNIPYFFLRDAGIYYSVNTQTTLSTSEWHHIAFSWDASSNSISSFIDGVQVAGISGGSSSLGANDVLTIGARSDGEQIFNGSIDELRIWNDLRTPCEIYAGMNNFYTTVQPNLIASYSFNHGEANGTNAGVTSLTELNNNYNATLNNFTLTGSSSNWIASGVSIGQVNNNSETYYSNDIISSCGSFYWIDGNTYNSDNNTATHTYTSVNGCDSVVILNLTIDTPVSVEAMTDTIVCDVFSLPALSVGNYYTEPDGNGMALNSGDQISNSQMMYVYAENGTCTDETNFIVTVNSSTMGTDEHISCGPFTWIDGNTYETSNTTATYLLTNTIGCDSLVTLNLIVNESPLNTITVSGIVLTADEIDASYQWLDCANGNTPISNATSQSFTPNENGTYAAEIIKNDCIDTSDCIIVANLGLHSTMKNIPVTMYPNPTKELVNLIFDKLHENIQIRISDSQGRIVSQLQYEMIEHVTIDIIGEPGVYFITIDSSDSQSVYKCIKE